MLYFYYYIYNNIYLYLLNYYRFATDFQIFPYIVSKSKLNSYFTGICEYLNESNSSVRDNEISKLLKNNNKKKFFINFF
jgi:hypothetical protein